MSSLLSPLDDHNRELLASVHPLDHVNPKPAGRYNLVVIGAGTAGLVTAGAAAGLGAKVALVERHLMGGDCLNTGCVPSKALLRVAHAAAAARRAASLGIAGASEATVDFETVMARMRRLRAHIGHHDSVARFREQFGVDVFLGDARFVRDGVVAVDDTELTYAKAVIATGARAALPPIAGLTGVDALTNETIFSLTERPRRLIVIGAGPIGCELGQAFRRFGSEVTLVSQEILPNEDRDTAAVIEAALRHDGVYVEKVTEVSNVAADGSEKVVTFVRDGATQRVAGDAILVATGRIPNIAGLGLDTVGVRHGALGIEVDDHLRTSNRRIFAAGDVASRYQFTHAADALARIVVRNALFFGRAKASALHIPHCTYTHPEVAHVGITESAARRDGLDVRTFRVELRDVDRAIVDGETEGFFKAVVPAKSDRLLGLTIVAPRAGDMIGEAVLAIRHGIGLGKFGDTIHPYPTVAEALRKLGDTYNRTRVTPTVRRLFDRLMAWQR